MIKANNIVLIHSVRIPLFTSLQEFRNLKTHQKVKKLSENIQIKEKLDKTNSYLQVFRVVIMNNNNLQNKANNIVVLEIQNQSYKAIYQNFKDNKFETGNIIKISRK